MRLDVNKLGDVYKKDSKDVYVDVPYALFMRSIEKLKLAGVTHVTSVSGYDSGVGIDVLYAFYFQGRYIMIKTHVLYTKPQIESITKYFPGAKFFERETAEFLGLKVVGNETPKHLFLSEGYPKAPFRK